MTRIYTHEINKEIRSIGGRYEFEREGSINLGDGEILYAVGNAVLESSCCGLWGCRYVLVAGYVMRLKFAFDDDGNPLSEVIPIDDDGLQNQISAMMKKLEGATQVIFV